REGGALLVKVFQGAGFQELMRSLRLKYNKVQVRKPEASRARSRETYLLARGFRGRI
ncbi:MAG TPA: 23S rRNA methyltransferase, partial [Chromatiales bacterium]|nr:23S rRNA methyltransferase [Chromatiales bacterium]